MAQTGTTSSDAEVAKSCCAQLYEHEAVRLLVGDSLHPGGLDLTEQLGRALRLGPGSRLLDVASGNGASAFRLAEGLGCHVTGIDYSARNVAGASSAARARGLSDLTRFEAADAEHLPCADATFEAVICECSFCLFPDKLAAADEFARVLVPGGRVGISDLALIGALPTTLQGQVSRIACIADAQPIDQTVAQLERSGLRVESVERHDQALLSMVDMVKLRLLGAEVLAGLGKFDLPREELVTAGKLAGEARAAVIAGKLGYVTIVAAKPG